MASWNAGWSSAWTAWSVARRDVPLTTVYVAYASSRYAGSNDSIRFQSARYGDAGSCAWRATTRWTASGTDSGARSSSSWRPSVARFSARADRGMPTCCRPARLHVHLDLGHAHRSPPDRRAPARRLPRRRGLRMGLLRPRRGDDGHPRRAGGRHPDQARHHPARAGCGVHGRRPRPAHGAAGGRDGDARSRGDEPRHGIADAYLDRAPMVAITGQTGSDKLHKESHQLVDIPRMFEPVTKWTTRVGAARRDPRDGRPGVPHRPAREAGADTHRAARGHRRHRAWTRASSR